MTGSEETAYRFIGTTQNKLLVVVASYNGGGSGAFYTLHILNIVADKACDSNGKVYDCVDLTSLRTISLGDRWEGNVKIVGNVIEIETTRSGPADESGATLTRRIEARRP